MAFYNNVPWLKRQQQQIQPATEKETVEVNHRRSKQDVHTKTWIKKNHRRQWTKNLLQIDSLLSHNNNYYFGCLCVRIFLFFCLFTTLLSLVRWFVLFLSRKRCDSQQPSSNSFKMLLLMYGLYGLQYFININSDYEGKPLNTHNNTNSNEGKIVSP